MQGAQPYSEEASSGVLVDHRVELCLAAAEHYRRPEVIPNFRRASTSSRDDSSVDRSTRRPRADELLVRRRIRAIALRHGTYGIRRVTALARRAGLTINRKRVRRILASEGLLQPAHLPRPRLPPTGRLTAERPNERWYTDLTYLDTTDRGPCPLISFLNGYTPEVVAWRFLPSCGAAEASEVLDEAVLSRFPKTARATGLVLRSDGGSQSPPIGSRRPPGSSESSSRPPASDGPRTTG